jgi:hypothetical protein
MFQVLVHANVCACMYLFVYGVCLGERLFTHCACAVLVLCARCVHVFACVYVGVWFVVHGALPVLVQYHRQR